MKLNDLELGRFVLIKNKGTLKVGIISVVWGNKVDVTILGEYTYIEADPIPEFDYVYEKDNFEEIVKLYPENYTYLDCLKDLEDEIRRH